MTTNGGAGGGGGDWTQAASPPLHTRPYLSHYLTPLDRQSESDAELIYEKLPADISQRYGRMCELAYSCWHDSSVVGSLSVTLMTDCMPPSESLRSRS